MADADEWDDVDSGKGFTNIKHTSGTDSGWNSSNKTDEWGNNDGGNSSGGDGFRGRDRGRGGGGGSRGGRGGGGGGYRTYDNDRNDEENNNRRDGYEDRGRGRGRGRGGGRGGRGANNGSRNNDDDNEYDGGNTGDDGDPKFNAEKPKEFYIPPEPSEDPDEIFGSNISAGINFDKFDKIPINASGENVPPSITSFETSGLRDFILGNVKKSGYTKPTPIQKHAIPIVLAGRDLMGCAQTGSGKTAAFLLPMLESLMANNYDLQVGKPHVVVVSPTRELAIQIYNEARKFALSSFIKTCIVYGGTATRHQSTNITKGCHILIATPGRLLDFVEKAFITFEDVKFVVLDEADRMLDMGFMPSIEKMMNHPTMPACGSRQTLMFSATFPEEIQHLAGQFLKDYIFLAVGVVGSACTDVEQKFVKVTKFEKRKKLMEILEERDPDGTMIFVETKRNADFLASLLSETAFPTTSIHGDRMQREREEALRDFKLRKMKILIGTAVAARGLDIKNVNHVINYDMPKSIDEYVHRIGRTGRVGNKGKATSFFDEEQDRDVAPDLITILKQAQQPIPDFLEEAAGGRSGGGHSGGGGFGGRDYRSGGGGGQNVRQNNIFQ